MAKATATKICPVCGVRFFRDSGSSDPAALSTGKKYATHPDCYPQYRKNLKAQQNLTRSLNTAYNGGDMGWLLDSIEERN